MQDKKFQRRIEDFTCGHCGADVIGSGYTNHCPKCLWSKHVDINPGDRANSCSGIMEPALLEGTSPEYRILHVCKKCGEMRRVNVSKEDDTDALVKLASNSSA